jgi:hypothetical protein
VIIWVVALALVAFLYKIDDVQPALSDLLRPLYFIILAVALLITWKWFRARAGLRSDRRHADRRRSDRRDDDEPA